MIVIPPPVVTTVANPVRAPVVNVRSVVNVGSVAMADDEGRPPRPMGRVTPIAKRQYPKEAPHPCFATSPANQHAPCHMPV